MIVKEFLSTLIRNNIELTVKGSVLRAKAPEGVIGSSLKKYQKSSEIDLLDLLNFVNSKAPSENFNNSFNLLLASETQEAIFKGRKGKGACQSSSADNNSHHCRAYKFSELPDIKFLEKAFNSLVQRHETLRTHFTMVDGTLLQVLAKQREVVVQVMDKAFDAVRDIYAESSNFSESSLLKIKLFKGGAKGHTLLVALPSIIADARSADILEQEWAYLYGFYTGNSTLKNILDWNSLLAPAEQYSDFCRDQQPLLGPEEQNSLIDYWATQLLNAPTLLELPTDRPRPAEKRQKSAAEIFTLPQTLIARARVFAEREHVSLRTLLIAAFMLLLSRYSGASDICIASPFLNRLLPSAMGVVGPLEITGIVRCKVDGEVDLNKFLQHVNTTLISTEKYLVPFERLLPDLKLTADSSYAPLCQVFFAVSPAAESSCRLPDFTVLPIDNYKPVGIYDLVVNLREYEGNFQGCLSYDGDLFDATTIQRMLNNYQQLLLGMMDYPKQRLADIPIHSKSASFAKKAG